MYLSLYIAARAKIIPYVPQTSILLDR